jgi:hypothetical protein
MAQGLSANGCGNPHQRALGLCVLTWISRSDSISWWDALRHPDEVGSVPLIHPSDIPRSSGMYGLQYGKHDHACQQGKTAYDQPSPDRPRRAGKIGRDIYHSYTLRIILVHYFTCTSGPVHELVARFGAGGECYIVLRVVGSSGRSGLNDYFSTVNWVADDRQPHALSSCVCPARVCHRRHRRSSRHGNGK